MIQVVIYLYICILTVKSINEPLEGTCDWSTDQTNFARSRTCKNCFPGVLIIAMNDKNDRIQCRIFKMMKVTTYFTEGEKLTDLT